MPYAPNRRVLCPECKKEFVTSNRNVWAPRCGECIEKSRKPMPKEDWHEKYFDDCPICGKNYKAKGRGKRHILCETCRKIVTISDIRALTQIFKELLASNKQEYFEKMRVAALRYLKEKYGTKSLMKIKEINARVSTGDTDLWLKTHKMQECVRLHAKMDVLPCGKREECFGNPRCEKCPPKAHPPTGVDLWLGTKGYFL